jgi:hypothetical protein
MQGHVVRERRVSIQVKTLFFRNAPVTPRRKVTARCEVYMAPYIRRKLVDKLYDFHRLHKRPYKAPIVTAHTNLGRATKCSANRNRPSAIEVA